MFTSLPPFPCWVYNEWKATPCSAAKTGNSTTSKSQNEWLEAWDNIHRNIVCLFQMRFISGSSVQCDAWPKTSKFRVLRRKMKGSMEKIWACCGYSWAERKVPGFTLNCVAAGFRNHCSWLSTKSQEGAGPVVYYQQPQGQIQSMESQQLA